MIGGRFTVREPGVILDESRYPGAWSSDFTLATAAREQAIRDCYTGIDGSVVPRPRPLQLPPCQRAAAGSGNAYSYAWNAIDLAAIAATYNLGSSGDVRYHLTIEGIGQSMFHNVQVRFATGQKVINFPAGFNVDALNFKNWTALGRQNLSTTDDGIIIPGGRALKDFTIENFHMQWFRNQLQGGVGRFHIRGVNNWNNAAATPVDVGGSDGGLHGQWYIDSRALPAGSWLVKLALSDAAWNGQLYLTPNSGGGVFMTGRTDGFDLQGLEVNGLGDQAPEYAYDQAQHVAANAAALPSASTAAGLIYFQVDINSWVKSNGSAWSLYFDGTAAIGFNGLASRPATGTAGKIYQNTSSEPFATGGSDPSISYWSYWNSTWMGPSYWNRTSIPAWISGHTLMPVYIGTDAPGFYAVTTRGQWSANVKCALVNMVPGIVGGSVDGCVEAQDAFDEVRLQGEVAFANAGKRWASYRNSGAVGTMLVRSGVRPSRTNPADLPAASEFTSGTVTLNTY